MNLLSASPRRALNNDDSLIPLINIVFLLLIFFMIAGQISSEQGQTIQPPFSNSEKALVIPPVVLVIDHAQQLYLDGHSINLPQLDKKLREIISLQTADTVKLAIKADQAVTAGQLDKVLKVIRGNGVTTLSLYTLSRENLP